MRPLSRPLFHFTNEELAVATRDFVAQARLSTTSVGTTPATSGLMSRRGLLVGPSLIEGRGCFAGRPFTQGRKVGELRGERITRAEARRRAARRQRIRICDVDDRTAIDATSGADATAFINHSCEPNLYSRTVRGHVLFFALRPIGRGEELSLDYGVSYHEGRKRCRCGALGCRGVI